MQQTQVPTPTVFDRRHLAPPRAAPPALVVDLAGGDDFAYLVERQTLRCQRDRVVLSALHLQVLFEAESDPDPGLRVQLLAECARRLCSRVRSSDCVARWQGTHFGVLLPRCEPVHAEAVLARLTHAAGGLYRLGELLLHLRLQGRLFGAAES